MRIWGLFLAALLALSACDRLPPAELSRFSATFAETKTAGGQILDEVSAVIPVQESAQAPDPCAINPRTGFRPCFRVDLALAGPAAAPAESPDIQVRRLALEVIATYVSLLVDIADGRSGQVIDAKIDELSGLADAVAAFAPATAVAGALPFAAVKGIVVKLENARSETLAVKSLLEAEPDIRELIRLMIDDTPNLYKVYVSQYEGELGRVKIAKRRAELSGDGAEAERLAIVLRNLQDPAGSANRARTFEAALTKYVQILDATDDALVSLTTAIREPMLSPVERATAFVREATEMRVMLDGLKKDLRALRDADR